MCDLKAASKDKDKLSKGSSSHDDIPYDFERKEKFKMVIGGPKKDVQASSLCSLSSRDRSSTPKSILNGDPSFSMPIDSSQKVDHSEKEGSRTSDVSVAKGIAKTAALAAASEADSSEACSTREQKQKAERLNGGHGTLKV
uniref:Uncharacterized protein n=1 Tax=Nelumbo nucifera TaxID=4432 RepID=A0A822ZQ67_NELNU|nr:TPA_asm: hypothetical protein HUJ06_016974 [Nelumbo nucifera]